MKSTNKVLKVVWMESGGKAVSLKALAPGDTVVVVDNGDGTYALEAVSPSAAGKVLKSDGAKFVSAALLSASGEVAGLTEKTDPLAADNVLIESAADGNAKRRVQLANLYKGVPKFGYLAGSAAPAVDQLVSTHGSWVAVTNAAVTWAAVAGTALVHVLLPRMTPTAGDVFIFVGYSTDGGSSVQQIGYLYTTAAVPYGATFPIITAAGNTTVGIYVQVDVDIYVYNNSNGPGRVAVVQYPS